MHGKLYEQVHGTMRSIHTMWRIFLLSSLESSKEDGELDHQSMLETGLCLTSPLNAGKSLTFLVQRFGSLVPRL